MAKYGSAGFQTDNFWEPPGLCDDNVKTSLPLMNESNLALIFAGDDGMLPVLHIDSNQSFISSNRASKMFPGILFGVSGLS